MWTSALLVYLPDNKMTCPRQVDKSVEKKTQTQQQQQQQQHLPVCDGEYIIIYSSKEKTLQL